MPTVHLETFIAAPRDVCFDLARDVRAHVASAAQTRERAVGGRTTGLLEEGDEVTWEGVHFGVKRRLTARVTRCEPPELLEDVMVRGDFHSFTHTHRFRETQGGTVMVDDFRFTSPLGPLGRIADVVFLERYMRSFLQVRASALKQQAESRSRQDGP